MTEDVLKRNWISDPKGVIDSIYSQWLESVAEKYDNLSNNQQEVCIG